MMEAVIIYLQKMVHLLFSLEIVLGILDLPQQQYKILKLLLDLEDEEGEVADHLAEDQAQV